MTTPCEKNCPDPAEHKALRFEIGVIERMLQDRPESADAILSGGVAHLMSRGLPEAQANDVSPFESTLGRRNRHQILDAILDGASARGVRVSRNAIS